MSNVKVYTDDSVVDLGSGNYFRLRDLSPRILLKKYRKQKKKTANMDSAFISYVKFKLPALYKKAKASRNNGLAQSIKALGIELNDVPKDYLDDSLINLGDGFSFKICDISPVSLLKKYTKERQKNDPDIRFIRYVESNLDKLHSEAKNSHNTTVIKLIEGLNLSSKEKTRSELLDEICKKIIYVSKSEANRALRNMENIKQNGPKPVRSYECDKCSFWHLTSVPLEVWKLQKSKE